MAVSKSSTAARHSGDSVLLAMRRTSRESQARGWEISLAPSPNVLRKRAPPCDFTPVSALANAASVKHISRDWSFRFWNGVANKRVGLSDLIVLNSSFNCLISVTVRFECFRAENGY